MLRHALTAGKRSPICSTGAANWSLDHFMLGPGWRRAASAARSAPTTWQRRAPGASRRHGGRCFACALAENRSLSKAYGWGFTWVSSYGSTSTTTINVSLRRRSWRRPKIYYNYRITRLGLTSACLQGRAGNVFRTYSSYARGAEELITTYMVLDLTPKGRQRDGTAS